MSQYKVPFLVVAVQVEKLYEKQISEHNNKEIQEHCNFIDEFILACGWDPSEYEEMWINEQGSILS